MSAFKEGVVTFRIFGVGIALQDERFFGHLVEANTDPTHRPPSYMARSPGAVRFHKQGKSIGDANRVLYFERSPCIRQVAHHAINSGLIFNVRRS